MKLLKAFLIPAMLYMLIAACQLGTKQQAPAIAPRNTMVNPGNAYNDLFLDSPAVARFIAQQHLNDTLANTLRSFYNVRNFEYAWFDSHGPTEQGMGFRSLYHYRHDTSADNDRLENQLDDLSTKDDTTISGHEAGIVKMELQLSLRFIQYMLNTYKSLPVTQLEQFVPIEKQPVLKLADSVLADKSHGHKRYETANPAYTAMEKPLQQYVDIARKGGWDTVTMNKKRYRKGDTGITILQLKKRLQATGEMPAADSSPVFDIALEKAVKAFQHYYGYTPTGMVSDTLVQEMNVSAKARVQQLLINMERMHWMPPAAEGRLVVVNIPEFMLHVWEGKRKVFDMPVVVGREGHSTTMFSGEMNQVVFNPYWHVPAGIVRREILPAMEKNKHYLEENDMEITGERNGLPVIRQRPGKKNALGRVKFIFPNSFNIYLHDTPAKGLFNSDKRAYSHGCIRLSDPAKMADYVLHGMPGWTPEKIDSAMNRGDQEKYIKLKQPVPVRITYYTAWVDEQGNLQFREDIYGHDQRSSQKMFTDPEPVL